MMNSGVSAHIEMFDNGCVVTICRANMPVEKKVYTSEIEALKAIAQSIVYAGYDIAIGYRATLTRQLLAERDATTTTATKCPKCGRLHVYGAASDCGCVFVDAPNTSGGR